jgi:conjugative transfer pilus assembly protein TraH
MELRDTLRVFKLSAAAIAVSTAISSHLAHADWLGDFYTSAGARMNVTRPQAINSQNVVGYSGGGLVWRIPSRNLQPFQFTPPSMKAGCNGIDIFLGAFSFPNKEQFVQALRNFGQSALGAMFLLALDSMSPQIGAVVKEIQHIAQIMNQFMINSCQAGAQFGDALGRQVFGVTSGASGSEASQGNSPDYFAAFSDLKTDMGDSMEKLSKAILGNKNVEAVPASTLQSRDAPPKVNVTWYAMLNSRFPSEFTKQQKEIAMSLIGTMLIKTQPDTEGDDALVLNSIAGTVGFRDLVGLNTDGSATVKILQCDASESCLNPGDTNHTITPFAPLARKAIASVRNRISTRSTAPLAADEELVIRMANVPLYRVAALAQGSGVASGIAIAMEQDFADYAALDAASNFVNYNLNEVRRAIETSEGKLHKYEPQVKRLLERIQETNNEMNETLRAYYAQKGDPYEKIDMLDRAERAMYANLSSSMVSNARFGEIAK